MTTSGTVRPPSARRRRELPVLLVCVAALCAAAWLAVAPRGTRPSAAPPSTTAAAPPARPPSPSPPARTTVHEFLDAPGAATRVEALCAVAATKAWAAPLFDSGRSVPLGQTVVERAGVMSLVRWERDGARLRFKTATPIGGGNSPWRVFVLRSVADWTPGAVGLPDLDAVPAAAPPGAADELRRARGRLDAADAELRTLSQSLVAAAARTTISEAR